MNRNAKWIAMSLSLGMALIGYAVCMVSTDEQIVLTGFIVGMTGIGMTIGAAKWLNP